jgi:hypothetical protein
LRARGVETPQRRRFGTGNIRSDVLPTSGQDELLNGVDSESGSVSSGRFADSRPE